MVALRPSWVYGAIRSVQVSDLDQKFPRWGTGSNDRMWRLTFDGKQDGVAPIAFDRRLVGGLTCHGLMMWSAMHRKAQQARNGI